MQLLYKDKYPLSQSSLKMFSRIEYLTCITICHTASFLSKFQSNSIINDTGLHVHSFHKLHKTLHYQLKHEIQEIYTTKGRDRFH